MMTQAASTEICLEVSIVKLSADIYFLKKIKSLSNQNEKRPCQTIIY